MADDVQRRIIYLEVNASRGVEGSAALTRAFADVDKGATSAGGSLASMEAAAITAGGAAQRAAADIVQSTGTLGAAYRSATAEVLTFAKANATAMSSAAAQSAGYARLAQQTIVDAGKAQSRALMASVEASTASIKAMYFGAAAAAESSVSASYREMSAAGQRYAADVERSVQKTKVAEVYQASLRTVPQYTPAGGAAPGSSGAPLTPQQRLMLGYQFNDIFTQLAGGASPGLIAAQQGPQITQVFGGIGNTLAAIPKPLLIGGGAALGAAAILATVSALKDMNDALETQKRRLGDVVGDQRLSAQAYGEIRTQARAAGEEIEKTAAKYEQFSRAGASIGATTGQVGGLLSVFNTVGKLGGSTQNEQSAAAGALAQALKDSVVSASSLDTILENMPGLGRRIADGLGLSVVQLRLMAQQGDLSNKQVFEALLSQQAKVAAEFKQIGITVGGFFSSILQGAQDAAVALYKVVTGIELVNSKAEAARKAQAANANRPTPATPRVIGANGTNLTYEEMIGFGEAGQADSSLLNNPARLTNQLLDFQRAARAAADEAVLAGAKVADKLFPDMRELQQQTDTVTKSLEALQQKGLSGLDASKAEQATKRQAEALQFLRDRALDAKSAYDQALQSVMTRHTQDEIGMTPGQRATATRVKQLTDSRPGVTTEAAQSIVSTEQLQMLDDMVAKQQLELAAQTAITQSMRNGKAAADDAAVAMQVLGISIEQLGAITPEAQVKLDVLAETLSQIKAQGRAQAGIDASKPLITELAGIAAAMKVVEQGAYAMKRAQAEAKAARDETGTGDLQMKVFDAQQGLADASNLANLQKEIDLTNALAAAAGDVAKQKQIQLDYDIKRARLEAGPGAAALIAEKMRAKSVADATLEAANGTAELQRLNVVLEAQIRLRNESPEIQAREIALIRAKQELEKAGLGNDTAALDARRQAIEQNETLKNQAAQLQQADQLWLEPWKQGLRNIQTSAADAYDRMLQGASDLGSSMVDVFKTTARRIAAELLALATIRPVIQIAIDTIGPNGLGIIGGNTAAQLGFPTMGAGSGSPLGGGSILGGGGGGGGGGLGSIFGSSAGGEGAGWFGRQLGGVREWFNSPIFGMGGSVAPGFTQTAASAGSAYGFADMAGAYGGLGGAAAPTGALGGLTWGSALGGIASIGMGAMSALSGKGMGSTIGGIAQMAGGVMMMVPGLQIPGMVLSVLGGFGGMLDGGGPKIPPMPDLGYGQGTVTMNGGIVASGGLASTANAIGTSVQSLIKASGGSGINGRLWGGTVQSGTTHTWDGQQWAGQDYSSANIMGPDGWTSNIGGTGAGVSAQDAADKLTFQIFRQDVLSSAISGISDSLKQTLSTIFLHLTEGTAQAAADAVSFAKTYDQIGKAANPAEDAIDKLNATFADLRDKAVGYGLSVEGIDSELAKQTKRSAQDFIDNMLDPMAVQLRALNDERDAALASAEYIRDNVEGVYVDMDRIASYYTKKEADLREQFYGGAVDSLQAAIDRLKPGGNLSNLDPSGTLAGLKATYEGTLAQAMANDPTAIAHLANAGTQYADYFKSYSGGNSQYAGVRDAMLAAFQQVQASIQMPANLNSPLDTSSPALSQLVQTVQQLMGTVKNLTDALESEREDNTSLRNLLNRTLTNRAA